jgi:hypothetical protein
VRLVETLAEQAGQRLSVHTYFSAALAVRYRTVERVVALAEKPEPVA